MLLPFRKSLSADEVERAAERVIEAAEAGDEKQIEKALRPLLRAQPRSEASARRLLELVDAGYLGAEVSCIVLTEVFNAHRDDPELAGLIGETLESARDIDLLNDAPPEHPLFTRVLEQLTMYAETEKDPKVLRQVLYGLANTARLMARQHDDVADSAYRRLVKLFPDNSSYHYNYGLFLKTRGRFGEGLQLNKQATSMVAEPQEAYDWNLGICATGAGEGAVALEVWKRLGNKIEMGRFELPEGGYPPCKVRVAERPLAERSGDNDDPGAEETIWIERLSPCHGVVRSVLYGGLGVDYGDVILIDGAPITYHTYGEDQYPVFPHLATLKRQHFHFYDFAGTQSEPGQLEKLGDALERDSVVYSHSEHLVSLCANCWRDPDLDHDDHRASKKHVVTGRVAAPPGISPATLLQMLDSIYADRDECDIYVPDLCVSAGESERADTERRRFDMLRNN